MESGAGRGTGLGFPTANIRLADGQSLGHGIYAVRVFVDGALAHGAPPISARGRPSTPARRCWKPSCSISTAISMASTSGGLIDFVRPDAKFRSGTDLASQMQADVAKAKAILAASGG